jgi:hypothetical protein
MFENLCAVFTASSNGETSKGETGGDVLTVPGVRAARHYEARTVSGSDGPAGLPGLVLFEIDSALDPAGSALRRAVDALCSADEGDRSPQAYLGTGRGGHGEIELPAHLYLNFSAQPGFMNFDAYSDWYEEHQADNIANTPTLRRGWRFELTPFSSGTTAGPTHLAAYQLEDELAAMQADLDGAMAAGVISLPEWFDRFASIEAVALDDRTTAAR